MDKKAATPVAEHYEEIREDLENLKALNIQIDSVTCDGHRAILKAVRKVFKRSGNHPALPASSSD
jgi:hypothetical protein